MTKRETVLGIMPLKCQEKLFVFGGLLFFFKYVWTFCQFDTCTSIKSKTKTQELDQWFSKISSSAAPGDTARLQSTIPKARDTIRCRTNYHRKIKRCKYTSLSSVPSEPRSSSHLWMSNGALRHSQSRCSGRRADWEALRHLKPTLSLLATTQPS